MATWGASSYTGNVLNAEECCEFLLAGYVNLSPKHTHTHKQNDGVESGQLGRSEQLVWGGLTFQVKAAQVVKMTNGENRLWNLSSREESFIKGIKSVSAYGFRLGKNMED